MLRLQCGCLYSSQRKSVIKYCSMHLSAKIKNNIAMQNQINAELEAQRTLLAEQEAKANKSRFKFKQIFKDPREIFKKKLFQGRII